MAKIEKFLLLTTVRMGTALQTPWEVCDSVPKVFARLQDLQELMESGGAVIERWAIVKVQVVAASK